MPNKIIQLEPPLGGLNRALGFQSQAPFTTYDANNVRPRERDFDRRSIGSRPGLALYALAGSRVQMLETVGVKSNDRFDFWTDYFDAPFEATAPLSGSGYVAPSVSNGMAYVPASAVNGSFSITGAGHLNDYITALAASPTATYRFGIYIVPYLGVHTTGGVYSLIFAANTNPSYTNCGVARFTITAGGAWTIALVERDSSVETPLASASGTDSADLEGWLVVERAGNAITVYWRGTSILTGTLATETGAGLAVTMTNAVTRLQIDRVRVEYSRVGYYDLDRPRVIVARSGLIYREGYFGSLTASSVQMQLATSGYIMGADSGQKLYIADNPQPAGSGTDGVATATSFDAASVSDWTTVITNARRGDYLLQVDPVNRQSASGLLNSNYYYGSLLAHSFSDNAMGANPTVKVAATLGTFTLSGVTGLTFSVGDGTNDATMTFTSSAATPALKNAAIATALTNSFFTASGSTSKYAEVTMTVTKSEGGTVTVPLKHDLGATSTKTTANSVVIENTTNYEIDAVASGNLTIHGGPSSTTSGLTWRIVRCPKVYDVVADEEVAIASGTDGVVTGTNTFDSATYSNWETTLAGKDLSKYDIQLASSAYSITSIAAGGGTLGITAATNDTGLTFSIKRNDALVRWRANRGEVPVGCTMVARYQDRLVLAGNSRAPTNWYMSRLGDPLDFFYADVDVGAAVMGALQPAGKVFEPITSLMPFNDDNFFFGCRSSLWLLRGNPAGGGRIDNVSYTIGVISRTSWCHGPMGELVWLSRDGIWMTNPDCMTCEPVSISREKLPRELLDVNPLLYDISMAYDVRFRGIDIFLTPSVSSTSAITTNARHWHLNWETKGFFPQSFANKDHNPVCVKPLMAADAADTCVLMAGFSGNLYRFSRTADNDAGTAISSYVNFGPLKTTQTHFHRGMVRSLDVVMGELSDDTTWAIYVSDTPETVSTKTTAFLTGTFTEGANYTITPMMSGNAWVFKISGTGRWTYQNAVAVISQYGKDRLIA